MFMTKGNPARPPGPRLRALACTAQARVDIWDGEGGGQVLTSTAHGSDSDSGRPWSKKMCPEQSASWGSGI